MNKSILVTLSLSLGLVGGLSAVGNTANASTLRGLPHVLRNSKWQSKKHYMKYRNDYEANSIHFHKTSVEEFEPGMVDPFEAYTIRYRYVGNHTYKLYGHQYGQGAINGVSSPWRSKIKVYNSHKIYYKDYTQTAQERAYSNKYVNVDYSRK